MIRFAYLPAAAAFGLAKGIVIVAVTSALDIGFLKSLAIAGVSAIIGAIGVIVAAEIAANESRKNRRLLKDVKGKIDADKREADEKESEPPC